MDRIRVGFLTPSLYLGGAERWLASLAAGLRIDHFDVRGIVVGTPNAVHPDVLAHVPRDTPVLHGRQYNAALAAACDVVINWGEGDLSMLAERSCQLIHVSQGQCKWTCDCIHRALPYADHWAAVSEAAARAYPNPARVTVIYNSVDPKRCQVTTPRPLQRAIWQAEPHEKLIGYVGRPSDEKNPLAAVYAAKSLGPPYRAVMIGGGPYAPAYHTMARRICENVIIQNEMDQIGNAYHALDCMMSASRVEGHSLALTEAWYCGCPTIATPTGATPELERDHGKLVVSLPIAHTPRDLVTTVIAALHPANPCPARAQLIARTRLTNAVMCKRWEAYLTHICHPNAPHAVPRPLARQVSNLTPPL